MRKILRPEVLLLKAIWRWKLLSYPLAKQLFFPGLSYWRFYKKIKRLIAERILIERDGTELNCPVLQLSKKGFEYLKYDLGFLKEGRFAAQSVTHDYLASVFQLGEFAFSPSQDVEFFTEQELQCSDDSLLPDWVPKSREHIPDGFTRINNEKCDSVIAIEVDLHLKPFLRYTKAGYYFDGLDSRTDVVFWLCDGVRLMERIFEHLLTLKLRRMEIHHFLLLDDFKKLGWDCVTRSGREKDKKIRDIYLARARPEPGKEPTRVRQDSLLEIFFSKKKSP